jgi:hypothetical protein
MTTTDLAHPAASDALARTARMRRVGLAAAMLTGPWLIVAANTGHSVMTLHGGDDLEPSHAIALATDHLDLDRWSNLAALLGSLLLVPAVLGAMRLVRTHAARLGLVGGVLMAAEVHLLLRDGLSGLHHRRDGGSRRLESPERRRPAGRS